MKFSEKFEKSWSLFREEYEEGKVKELEGQGTDEGKSWGKDKQDKDKGMGQD